MVDDEKEKTNGFLKHQSEEPDMEKQAVLSKLFQNKLMPIVFNFITTLNLKGRLGILDAVAEEFSKELEELKNILSSLKAKKTYHRLKNGEFVEAAPWNKRTLRQKKKDQSLDQEAWKRVRKPKKVKPGYKKKLKREQEAIKKQLVKENKRKR